MSGSARQDPRSGPARGRTGVVEAYAAGHLRDWVPVPRVLDGMQDAVAEFNAASAAGRSVRSLDRRSARATLSQLLAAGVLERRESAETGRGPGGGYEVRFVRRTPESPEIRRLAPASPERLESARRAGERWLDERRFLRDTRFRLAVWCEAHLTEWTPASVLVASAAADLGLSAAGVRHALPALRRAGVIAERTMTAHDRAATGLPGRCLGGVMFAYRAVSAASMSAGPDRAESDWAGPDRAESDWAGPDRAERRASGPQRDRVRCALLDLSATGPKLTSCYDDRSAFGDTTIELLVDRWAAEPPAWLERACARVELERRLGITAGGAP